MTIPKIPGSGINLDLKLGYLKKKKNNNSNEIKNNVRKAAVLWNVGGFNDKFSTAISLAPLSHPKRMQCSVISRVRV